MRGQSGHLVNGSGPCCVHDWWEAKVELDITRRRRASVAGAEERRRSGKSHVALELLFASKTSHHSHSFQQRRTPSNSHEKRRTGAIGPYQNMPERQFKKVVNQEDFLTQRLSKLQVKENKAMLGSDLPDLKVDELTSVSSRLEEILKRMGESIAKISGKPPVLQPQAPYVPNNMDMGSSATYQASPLAPHVLENMDMGSQKMNQVPSPTPYVTGSMHMGPPMMYHVPPLHEGWLETVISGRDLDALVHNAYSTNRHDSVGTSANAGSSGGMKPFDVGFGWQSGGIDPEESSWSLFPPM
uniref:MADS-box domain-containing protein n=1 Tax=Aegilops tauschii TaxID=37682 RepID=N1QY75_AEGTA